MLNIREDHCFLMIGIVCSSFVAISSGTHKRRPFAPLGDQSISMVRSGNLFMSRTLLEGFAKANKRNTLKKTHYPSQGNFFDF